MDMSINEEILFLRFQSKKLSDTGKDFCTRLSPQKTRGKYLRLPNRDLKNPGVGAHTSNPTIRKAEAGTAL